MKYSANDILTKFKKLEVHLKPTQELISLPILNRISKKMEYGIQFEGIKVCEGVIMDGHHRYLASILTGYEIESYPTLKTSATIVGSWDEVEFSEEEWDTPEKIDRLNELDAKYNELSLAKIRDILK